jgi:hypothetical protein
MLGWWWRRNVKFKTPLTVQKLHDAITHRVPLFTAVLPITAEAVSIFYRGFTGAYGHLDMAFPITAP